VGFLFRIQGELYHKIVNMLLFAFFMPILFHILMFQQNSIKACRNLHMNVAIAYRENGVLSKREQASFRIFHPNHVPHIDVPAEFNQGMSESAHERRNRLQRERHAKQRE